MFKLNRRAALIGMVLTTLFWSIAGVVSRHLQAAQGFEVTFWRSAFCAASLWLALPMLLRVLSLSGNDRLGSKAHRSEGVWAALLRAAPQPAFWVSSLSWACMFTAFMFALMQTSVANVLIAGAPGPLITALLARIWLGSRIPPVTWWAIALCTLGVVVMYAPQVDVSNAQSWRGIAVAALVPLAGSVNWAVFEAQRRARLAVSDKSPAAAGSAAAPPADDSHLLLALALGATCSALFTLPFAQPFQATGFDVSLLALLGVLQLTVPCVIAVVCARTLAASEMALLAMLEIIFGISWAWLGTAEQPSLPVLLGGGLVMAALVLNTVLGAKVSAVKTV